MLLGPLLLALELPLTTIGQATQKPRRTQIQHTEKSMRINTQTNIYRYNALTVVY